MQIFKRFIAWFIVWLVSITSFGFVDTANAECENGIELNTDVPFVGDCISFDDSGTKPEEAFPTLMWAVIKITFTALLITGFLLIIVWWVMMAASGAEQSLFNKGKELVIKVVIWVILLGTSWVILHVINPNFFK